MNASRQNLAAVSLEVAVDGFESGFEAQLEIWADAAIRCGGKPLEKRFAVNVKIVDEEESRELNNRFRSIPRATNVLAFPVGELAFRTNNAIAELGDLAICMPVVQREAVEQNKEFAAHMAHMVVHGTLHLMGYDHGNDPDAADMEAREQRALAALGFPDPYAAAS